MFIILIVVTGSILMFMDGDSGEDPNVLPTPVLATPIVIATEVLITEVSIELWSPARVEAPAVPIRFVYTTNKASSCMVEVQYKLEGTTDFRKATMEGDATFTCPVGESELTMVWNKDEDAIGCNT